MLKMSFEFDPEACKKLIDGFPPIQNPLGFEPYGVLIHPNGSKAPVVRNHNDVVCSRLYGAFSDLPPGAAKAIHASAQAAKAAAKRAMRSSGNPRQPGPTRIMEEPFRINLFVENSVIERIGRPYSQWIRDAIDMRLEAEDKSAAIQSLL